MTKRQPFIWKGKMKDFQDALNMVDEVLVDINRLPTVDVNDPPSLTVDPSWDWTLPERYQG